MGLTQITTGGVDDNINIDSNTLKVDGTNNRVGVNRGAPDNQLSIGSTASFHTDANSFYLGSNFTSTGSNFIGSSKHAQRLFFNNANGNGYLSYSNTSSAGTAGNAITWEERLRIDSSGNVGIGSTDPADKLEVVGDIRLKPASGANTLVNFEYNNGVFAQIRGNGRSGSPLFGDLEFWTKGSGDSAPLERMVVDADGKVGIGTTSPGVRLHVNVDSASETDVARFQASNGADIQFLDIGVDPTSNLVSYDASGSTGGAHVFRRGGTEVMRLDNSSRLLVGTSTNVGAPGYPTSWSTLVSSSLQVAGDGLDDSSISVQAYGTNAVSSPSFIFAKSQSGTVGSATGLVANGARLATISFTGDDGAGFTAAASIEAYVDGTPGTDDMPGRLVFSTTADGASSPTERVRIDSSGRLGVGASSPSTILNIRTDASDDGILLEKTNGTDIARLFYDGTSTDARLDMFSGGAAKIQLSANGNSHFSGGNVGIGVAAPANSLHIAEEYPTIRLQSDTGSYQGRNTVGAFQNLLSIECDNDNAISSSAITFGVDGSERMRIDSSGRLLVGTSATWDSSVHHQFKSLTSNGWALNVNSTNTGSENHLLITTGRSTAGGNLIRVETNHSALGGAGTTLRFRVDNGGNIYATNTTVQSTSDERLKENIRNSEDGLAVINQLRPVRFDWKQDQHFNEGTNQLGFIAQEVEAVFPEAVGVAPLPSDFIGDDPEYKTVGPGAFIPVLVKALQEASAKIETLETKVAALEAAE